MSSILKGVDEVIEQRFSIRVCQNPHDLSVAALKNFSRRHRLGVDLPATIELLYRRIERNWGRAAPRGKAENWRWERQKKISPKNKGPEIRFARAVANFADCSWANHIPTSSGLSLKGGEFSQDSSRSIDLGHSDGSRHELIELKAGQKCQSAVFAAFEILISGLLYIFSHQHPSAYKYDSTRQYIRSTVIDLIALCPAHCYSRGDFQWLQQDINRGIELVTGYTATDLTVRFAFQKLPPFHWTDEEHRDLITYLQAQDAELRRSKRSRLKPIVDAALQGRGYVYSI
jgi:hypothetical protein